MGVSSLPHASLEHGVDAPARSEQVEGLGEAVVVDEAGVDGEHAHQQDDVAALKEGVPDLHTHTHIHT